MAFVFFCRCWMRVSCFDGVAEFPLFFSPYRRNRCLLLLWLLFILSTHFLSLLSPLIGRSFNRPMATGGRSMKRLISGCPLVGRPYPSPLLVTYRYFFPRSFPVFVLVSRSASSGLALQLQRSVDVTVNERSPQLFL